MTNSYKETKDEAENILHWHHGFMGLDLPTGHCLCDCHHVEMRRKGGKYGLKYPSASGSESQESKKGQWDGHDNSQNPKLVIGCLCSTSFRFLTLTVQLKAAYDQVLITPWLHCSLLSCPLSILQPNCFLILLGPSTKESISVIQQRHVPFSGKIHEC